MSKKPPFVLLAGTALLVAGYLAIRSQPSAEDWKRTDRKLPTGEMLRIESRYVSSFFHGGQYECRVSLNQELVATFSPFLLEETVCDLSQPAQLRRAGDWRVLAVGPVLYWKQDSGSAWGTWSALSTEVVPFLAVCRGVPKDARLRLRLQSIHFNGSERTIEMQLDAPGNFVFLFGGDQFDWYGTMARNPKLDPIPFPDNIEVEAYKDAMAHGDPVLDPDPARPIWTRWPIDGKHWTQIQSSGKTLLIRGAYSAGDGSAYTLHTRATGSSRYVVVPMMRLGEWGHMLDQYSLYRIQPRLPAGGDRLTPVDVVDPIAAGAFAVRQAPFEIKNAAAGGELLAVRGWTEAHLIDASTGRWLRKLESVPASAECNMAFSPDSHYLAVISQSQLAVWEISSGKLVSTIATAEYSPIVFTGPDELAIAQNGQIEFRSVTDLRRVRRTIPSGDGLRALAISPDRSMLASGDWKGEVRTWELRSGRALRTWAAYKLYGNADNVRRLIFSPDGKMLLVQDNSPQNDVWSLETGAFVFHVEGNPFSPPAGGPAAGEAFVIEQEGKLNYYRSDGRLLRFVAHPAGELIPSDGSLIKLADGRIAKWNPETGSVSYFLTLLNSWNWRAAPEHRGNPEWMVTYPDTPYYASSEWGDDHAYVRFGPYLASLRKYRTRFRREPVALRK